jgi:hypothetical protein
LGGALRLGTEGYRTWVPGGIGLYNSIRIADLDRIAPCNELYSRVVRHSQMEACMSQWIFCFFFFAATALAQTTWIVDGNLGPGAQFAEVQPAIAAAAPNDTILVRATVNYQGFTIDKPLRVVGLLSATGYPAQCMGLITISGIGASETCLLSTFSIFQVSFGGPVPPPHGLRVLGNTGRVHIEALDVSGSAPGIIEFVNNARVETHFCGFACCGQPTTFRNTVARAGYCFFISSSPTPVIGPPVYLPTNALLLDNSTLTLQGSTIQGGNGRSSFQYSWPSTPGLSGVNSTLRLGPSCVARGGLVPGWLSPQYNTAIASFSGTVYRDPDTQINTSWPYVYETLNWTTVAAADRGLLTRIFAKGQPNSIGVVAVSFVPLQGVPVAPFGTLWLDLSSTMLLGGLACDATGWAYIDRMVGPLVPNDQSLVAQTVLLDPQGNLHLTEPEHFGIRSQ